MKKNIKLISILFILLLFTLDICYATDINMNLSDNGLYSENTLSNNEITNTLDNSATTTGNNIYTQSSSNNSATFSNISSVQDNSLGLSEILNILLITVGIVLILLGIAILIRLHS